MMEQKPEIKITYVLAELIREVMWETLVDYTIYLPGFLDQTMLWVSKSLSFEELVGYAMHVKELEESKGEAVWESATEDWLTFRFEFDTFVLILTVEG